MLQKQQNGMMVVSRLFPGRLGPGPFFGMMRKLSVLLHSLLRWQLQLMVGWKMEGESQSRGNQRRHWRGRRSNRAKIGTVVHDSKRQRRMVIVISLNIYLEMRPSLEFALRVVLSPAGSHQGFQPAACRMHLVNVIPLDAECSRAKGRQQRRISGQTSHPSDAFQTNASSSLLISKLSRWRTIGTINRRTATGFMSTRIKVSTRSWTGSSASAVLHPGMCPVRRRWQMSDMYIGHLPSLLRTIHATSLDRALKSTSLQTPC